MRKNPVIEQEFKVRRNLFEDGSEEACYSLSASLRLYRIICPADRENVKSRILPLIYHIYRNDYFTNNDFKAEKHIGESYFTKDDINIRVQGSVLRRRKLCLRLVAEWRKDRPLEEVVNLEDLKNYLLTGK